MAKPEKERVSATMAVRVGIWPTPELARVVRNALDEACNDGWPEQTNLRQIQVRVDQAAESGFLGPEAVSPSQRKAKSADGGIAGEHSRHRYLATLAVDLAQRGSAQPRVAYDHLRELANSGSAYIYSGGRYVTFSSPALARMVQNVKYPNFRQIMFRQGVSRASDGELL